MPRIRSVRPEFWEDARISQLSVDAAFTLLALTSHADDEGRLVGSVRKLDGSIHMAREGASVANSLVELEAAGLIRRYTANEQSLIQILDFVRTQYVDRFLPSAYPPPSDYVAPVFEPLPRGRRTKGKRKQSVDDPIDSSHPTTRQLATTREYVASPKRVTRHSLAHGDGDGGGGGVGNGVVVGGGSVDGGGDVVGATSAPAAVVETESNSTQEAAATRPKRSFSYAGPVDAPRETLVDAMARAHQRAKPLA